MDDPPRSPAPLAGSFPALAILYVGLFGAYGTESPFFPSFLAERGLGAADLGILFAVATIVRLASGPLVGIVADVAGQRRVLAIAAFAAGAIILLYIAGRGFWPLLAVAMLHSVATAPLNPLADALAIGASLRERTFAYGWVRGIGSGAFIAGTLASGLLVGHFGLGSTLVAASLLFFAMLVPLIVLPETAKARASDAKGAVAALLRDRAFRRMLLAAGLVIGSHAASNTFAVIEWRAAGIGATAVGLLWSEAVASEIVVFLALGPWLLGRLGPGRCAVLAAAAGVARWSVQAETTAVAALVATQALHGLTFSLMHLACMQTIGERVPQRLEGTAQTLYGALALGLASAGLTYLAGEAWGTIGPRTFWLMAAVCVVGLIPAHRMEAPEREGLRSSD